MRRDIPLLDTSAQDNLDLSALPLTFLHPLSLHLLSPYPMTTDVVRQPSHEAEADSLDELVLPPQYQPPQKHSKLGMLWDTFDAPPEVSELERWVVQK